MTQSSASGIVLPAGHTGSSLFHAVLAETAAQFGDVLAPARLPAQASAFKRDYGLALARFEAARAASARRVEIARFIVQRTKAALCFARAGTSTPLAEYLADKAEPPALERTAFAAAPSLRAEVPFEGEPHRGRAILDLAERLSANFELTDAALAALRWIVEHFEACGGVLDLRGQRFALLGAGAELAPTRMLLRAGADVLYVDRLAPERALGASDELSGALYRHEHASNLLEAPREIAAAIARFAERGPVHLGMFAYASGASQEWRLGAAMNAIASVLDSRQLASVALLVSPTTVPNLQPESVRGAEQRWNERPAWQSALHAAGLLPAPGYFEAGGVRVGRATVSIQGLSYQAAQYISKLAAAETFAVYGSDLAREAPRPLTVSANVAPITRTRSLSHPLFAAAFLGAPRFHVRIVDPATTRALSGLLILHDLLNPNAPGAAGVQSESARDKAASVLSQQIHGGIYSLPFVLEHAIRVAAVIGMGQRPSLLFRRPRPSTASS